MKNIVYDNRVLVEDTPFQFNVSAAQGQIYDYIEQDLLNSDHQGAGVTFNIFKTKRLTLKQSIAYYNATKNTSGNYEENSSAVGLDLYYKGQEAIFSKFYPYAHLSISASLSNLKRERDIYGHLLDVETSTLSYIPGGEIGIFANDSNENHLRLGFYYQLLSLVSDKHKHESYEFDPVNVSASLFGAYVYSDHYLYKSRLENFKIMANTKLTLAYLYMDSVEEYGFYYADSKSQEELAIRFEGEEYLNAKAMFGLDIMLGSFTFYSNAGALVTAFDNRVNANNITLSAQGGLKYRF